MGITLILGAGVSLAEVPAGGIREVASSRFYSIKVNTFIGNSVIRGDGGLVMGTQIGFGLFHSVPLYVGVEGNFSLFSDDRPTTITNLLVGAWYELRAFKSSTLGLFIGALGGIGVLAREGNPPGDQFLFLPQNPITIYADIGLAQVINDLVTIRAQFRPGSVDGNLAFMMNLSVQFRFI